MGFDNDCILNIQSLAGEYFCAVCRTLVYPTEAIQAPCTHLYCKPCLTYVVSTTHACPYDGYRVTEADSKPLLESNKTLADTIGKIQVHCLYYRTGCSWQGPLSDCTPHCSTCAFGESAVLCNKCGIQLKHRQVQEHAQNCSGVQSQVQQPGGVQDSKSSGAGAVAAAAPDQTQTAGQTGGSVSQAMSQTSTSLVSSQVANQTANSATQPQAAQAAMPTPEQMYQQQLQYQQQYQQHYQQYPGYDPYQQNYQYYYQYPQVAQQYQQQQTQAYPQAYGQPQPQGYVQTQIQPIVQAQQVVQPQVPSQGAQPPSQPQAQTAVNAQPLAPPVGQTQPQMQAQGQAQSLMQAQGQTQPQMPAQGQTQPQMPAQGQAQPQMQAHGQAQPQMQAHGQAQPQMQAQGQAPMPHALSYNQAQPLPQAQPYTQPQPVPQQQLQVPQYLHTHPQMQHPHMQPYPQSQTQHYPPSQPQVHSQPHSQPNLHPPAHPPQQPLPPSAQFQTPNTVTGYQSYSQPQLHSQAQTGAGPTTHIAGAQQLAHYSNQMQGQFPVQAAQMRPPQSYSNVPNQRLPAMLSAQGQPSSGTSAQQLPVHPQVHQPGYPFQQRPSVQAAQQAAPQQYGQQQSFPAQGAFMQHQPSMTAQLHAHGPPQMPPQSQQNYGQPLSAQTNVAHNYAGRPVGMQAVAYPYAQAAGHAGAGAGAGQVRPPQSNQNYPMNTNNQASSAEQQATQSQRASSGEKSHHQMIEKGAHDQMNASKEARDMGIISSEGSREGEMKLKAKNGLTVSTDGNDRENLLGFKQMLDTETKVDNQVKEVELRAKGDTVEGVSKTPGDADESCADDPGDGFKKADGQDLKEMAKHAADSSAPSAALSKSPFESQVHGANSYPSVDHSRNQLQPLSYGQHKHGASSMPQSMNHPVNSQQPALLGHSSNQLRPQGPGQAPASAFPLENPSGGILGPGSSGSLGRPGNVNHYLGNLPPHQAGQPQNPSRDPLAGPSVTAHRPGASRSEIEKFEAQRFGHFDGRQSDSHPLGPLERNSFGPGLRGIQPRAMKFGGPSALDSMPAPRMRDERAMPLAEEQLKRFPHREFEDDFRKFPRPPHLEAGSSNYGSQFPSSGPLDGNGMLRSFDRGHHGFDRDPAKMDAIGSGPSRLLPPFHPKDVDEKGRAFPNDDMRRADFRRPDFSGSSLGPGFGRHRIDGLPPRSPGRDYPGFSSRTLGPYRDVGGNGSRSFEGSKPYNFLAEPFGKPTHESRFPVPPRGDFDVPGNMRLGEHLTRNQDLMPSHLRKGGHMGLRSSHLGDVSAFGHPGGLSRIERPLGNFPPHVPFGGSFGGEKPGHPLQGEPGFRSGYDFAHVRNGGFYLREMDPFDNLRMRKPGSIMCRICKVECGSVEGLDLHSQSREHQRKSRDMVLSIKQQNKKKQKLSKDEASAEEERDGGRPRNLGVQGRGNKR